MSVRRAALVILGVLAAVRPAVAGTEEFSTFDVLRQEQDDESLLDHVLTRPPRAWRDEWEHAPQAMRTAQGCLTSGQWFIDTGLKLEAPLGEHARFGLDVRDAQSDRSFFTYFDLSFATPTRYGTPGFWFRPLFDKSRQDIGLFWETSADTSDTHLRLTFAFEDAFNNFWEFRQARVGEAYEPYERHPYEPAVRFHVRRPGWRAELDGQYLTPSIRRLANDPQARKAELWGTYGRALIELEGLGIWWSAAGDNRQARSVEPSISPSLDVANFRRQWAIDVSALRRLGARWEADLHWIYQIRDQDYTSDGDLYFPPSSFSAIDRVVHGEARWAVAGPWVIRAGGMLDHITMDVVDPLAGVRRGSGGGSMLVRGPRTESRAYVGFAARFGAVSLSAVEGIELDPESYEVWWVHDKAFVQLQAVF